MAPRKKETVHFKAAAATNLRLDRDEVMSFVLQAVNARFTGVPFQKSDLAGFDGISKFPDTNVFEFRLKSTAVEARGARDNTKMVLTIERIVPAEWTHIVRKVDITREFKRARRNLMQRQTRNEMGSELPYAYVCRHLETRFPGLSFTSFHTVRPAGVLAGAFTRFLCWYQGKPMDMEVFHPNQRDPFA